VLRLIKNDFAKERYHSDVEVKDATPDWRTQTGPEYIERGISNLRQKYPKSENLSGDYVEK